MQDLEQTYKRAVVNCGTEYALAKKLGCSKSLLYERRTKPLSPELWALIADIAGTDAREALIAATIERNAGKERGGWLRDALGKSLVAGVAAITLGFGTSGNADAAVHYASLRNTNLYIGAVTKSA